MGTEVRVEFGEEHSPQKFDCIHCKVSRHICESNTSNPKTSVDTMGWLLSPFEVAEEFEAESAPPSWATSPLLLGRWRLAYTSARTFAQNRGLTGYAKETKGVETPETFMTVTQWASSAMDNGHPKLNLELRKRSFREAPYLKCVRRCGV